MKNLKKLLLTLLILLIVCNCTKPNIITEYVYVKVPVRCNESMPKLAAKTGNIKQDIINIEAHRKELLIALKKCRGDK